MLSIVLAVVFALSLILMSPESGAQPPAAKVPRIGFLVMARNPGIEDAFPRGLRDLGYVEGRDVVIEWRSANGDYTRVPELVADLVQRKVEVIVAAGTVASQAAMRATSTIPIVMSVIADPVGSGLVANLAHPGGNVTGLSLMTTDLSAKRLQLLKEAIPRLTRVAVLRHTVQPEADRGA
jgi:putative ABC transport system substrate-binding protein